MGIHLKLSIWVVLYRHNLSLLCLCIIGDNTCDMVMKYQNAGSITISVKIQWGQSTLRPISSNSFHSLIFFFCTLRGKTFFLWCNKDFNNKHNQPCAWGNIQMDFLQTIELLNLLMKIYVYRWNTHIGAKIHFFS